MDELIEQKIQQAARFILGYVTLGWGLDQAVAKQREASTLGPKSWARVLELVNAGLETTRPVTTNPETTTAARELQHPFIPTMRTVIRTYRRGRGYTAFITLWDGDNPIDEYKCGPVLKRDGAWAIGEDFARQILRGWC